MMDQLEKMKITNGINCHLKRRLMLQDNNKKKITFNPSCHGQMEPWIKLRPPKNFRSL